MWIFQKLYSFRSYREICSNIISIVSRGNQQLCSLQAIQQFGVRLSEFQCALRRDKDTLAVLDAALMAGATMEVASSVRDVARLLSEKHECNNQVRTLTVSKSSTIKELRLGKATTTLYESFDLSQQNSILGETSLSAVSEDSGNVTQTSFSESVPVSCSLVGLEGGSLSDSGISDSGSEQELSERERRLAALRRLTRSLESQLTPGAEALLAELWRRVEDAEAELRVLQKQCRELIVRTAASVEARAKSPAPVVNYPLPR